MAIGFWIAILCDLVCFFKQVEILAIFSSYGLGVAKLLMVGFFIFIFIFWWLILFEIFGWSDIPRYISFRVMYIYIYIYSITQYNYIIGIKKLKKNLSKHCALDVGCHVAYVQSSNNIYNIIVFFILFLNYPLYFNI
jgi:hypothetical protein